MNNDKDLLKLIENKYSSFSKSHKKIADYILKNSDKVAYMTAAKLGETVGISDSTVVRFAVEIGFEGYPEFLKRLREVVSGKLTSIQRIEITSSTLSKEDMLDNVINSDIDKLKKTLINIDKEAFNNAISTILKAKTIYIVGVRSSASLASFLGFYFNLMFDNVKLIHTNSVSEMFEQILNISKDDVIIGISFPRYSRRTLNALQYAKKNGSKIVAVTDSNMSPLTLVADYSLIARSDMASFADSLVAPLSLINAIIVAIAMSKPEEISNTFTKLENIWDEYEVYDK
ncbi:MAG: MurR/RpiR family transcriptional regulator [Ruminococcaceae bacterium]|nr:MurR/RpiR family transcriptional regulator [Oscillospiraceae bacterium]